MALGRRLEQVNITRKTVSPRSKCSTQVLKEADGGLDAQQEPN
ncbi:hypothetical protein [Azospirillum palustre]